LPLSEPVRHADVASFSEMWAVGVPAQEIAMAFSLSLSSVYSWKNALHLPPRRRVPSDRTPDPTPQEIRDRARECRRAHYAAKMAEPQPRRLRRSVV